MLRFNEILSVMRMQPQPLKNTLQYCGDDNWDVITGKGLRRSSVRELVARCGRDDLASGRQGQVRLARGTLAGLEAGGEVERRRRGGRVGRHCQWDLPTRTRTSLSEAARKVDWRRRRRGGKKAFTGCGRMQSYISTYMVECSHIYLRTLLNAVIYIYIHG